MTGECSSRRRILAICGGVGGAKLALGLERILGPGELIIAINTGDDFEHLGLHISPDIDTVTYTLAGLNDTERGWGLAGESWNFMASLGRLGGETWFNLGDRDLATHVERTRRLKDGERLSGITADFARRLGIAAHLVPMSDDRIATIVETDEGSLSFQRYFVERQCRPRVKAIHFEGAGKAGLHADIAAALDGGDLDAIILCPSNPYLSIDPILAVPGLRERLESSQAPVLAISPIIGGAAVKGPTAKIMEELDLPVTSSSIATHYKGLIDGLVLDVQDASQAAAIEMPTLVTPTLMVSLDDRDRLARAVLDFAHGLRERRAQ